MYKAIPVLLLPLLAGAQPRPSGLMKSTAAEVSFISDAPMERITATNTQVSAVVDTRDRSFAVRVSVAGFLGFNSPLQQEHFNENYMESAMFPHATFEGKIIENVDLSVAGTHTVRAKGILSIHGVERERIIACEVVVTDGGVRVTSRLNVTLADHDIRVPGIVRQKIAPVVEVNVDLLFRHTR